MDDLKEVSYKCPVEGHPTWSGIEGEIPTNCPECGAEGEVVEPIVGGDTTVGGETGATGATGENEDEDDEDDLEEVETATYVITGLVDYTDEQGNIRGQLPIGSEQELPVVVGDAAVLDGRATRVE